MKHLKLLLVIIGVMMLANGPAAAAEYELHQAVLDNDLQLVKRLLSKGKAIDVIGSRKYGYGSALHLAVREGHVEIAKLLLDRGAEVDVLDPDDFTPLHNAAWNGNLEMTELLLAAGADINASTYCSLVQVGLSTGHSGGQSNHGHNRDAEKDDNTDIRHTLIADSFEDGIELYPVLNNYLVWLTAKTINSAQYV